MNSPDIFLKAAELAALGDTFIFAVTVQKSGSSPAREGAAMIITPTESFGSVGGSDMEASLIADARRAASDGRDFHQFYPIHKGDLSEESGAFILAAVMGPQSKALFECAAAAAAESRESWLIAFFEKEKNKATFLVNIDRTRLVGAFTASEKIQEDMLKDPIRLAVHADADPSLKTFVFALTAQPQLYIFGGGHVSSDTASLAVKCGFAVAIIDDSDEFANENRFPGCEILRVDSFESLDAIVLKSRAFGLIATRGHEHDRSVLGWAVRKNFVYLGMLGSAKKRDPFFASLIEEGVDPERLATVHCPVGLSIHAKTTQEIAVSIIAEVIAEKNSENRTERKDERNA